VTQDDPFQVDILSGQLIRLILLFLCLQLLSGNEWYGSVR